jgi:hypothetical protein
MDDELVFINGTHIETVLDALWHESDIEEWDVFIKSLDDNISKVRYVNWTTFITFKNEAFKSWFILRWS